MRAVNELAGEHLAPTWDCLSVRGHVMRAYTTRDGRWLYRACDNCDVVIHINDGEPVFPCSAPRPV